MEQIILYNPGVSTLNLGDKIIFDSVSRIVRTLHPAAFTIEISTHLPVSRWYMRLILDARLKIVCGTNLLSSTMYRFRQWNVNFFTAGCVGPVTLLGVGWWQYQGKANLYSRMLIRKLLGKDVLHSVRDHYTLLKLREVGVNNVVNTGCPTMWGLTEEHCASVPESKSNSVIFTLTDYRRNPLADSELIEILKRNYGRVRFWVQGSNDDSYLRSLTSDSSIEVIPPSLEAYDAALAEEAVDFVGTRLHGGIRALQHRRRTIIIGVDNRAEEKKKTFGLRVIARSDQHQLEQLLNSSFSTKIILPRSEIATWLSQFSPK